MKREDIMNSSNKSFPIVIGMLSFITWGSLPIYWIQLKDISLPEILSYRVLCSVLFAAVLVLLTRSADQVFRVFKSKRLFISFLISSILILINWTLGIYAIINGHMIDASMGYYINPLFNVLASALIFKIKMSRFQIVSIGFVIIGVFVLIIAHGSVPIVALSLALSFCLYGIIRKTTPISSFPGLFVEALIMTVPAGIYIIYLNLNQVGIMYTGSSYEINLLLLSGVITTLPLSGFAYVAQKLNLSTVGLLQYISPTISFLIGVFIYHETFTKEHLVAFIFIWIALIIYSVDSIVRYEIDKHKKLKELNTQLVTK